MVGGGGAIMREVVYRIGGCNLEYMAPVAIMRFTRKVLHLQFLVFF